MAGETPAFTGTFSVSELLIKIQTANSTFSTIKDVESGELKIDGTVQEWNSITDEGWGNALVTAKKWSLSLKGKRCVGDTGNDYLAGLVDKIGRACNTAIQITFPDGKVFQGNCAANVSTVGTGGATDVASLEAELVGQGKPTYGVPST